jgi:solute carrier family 10 (sodium/bile acid cotransporter), member 7
VLVLPVALGQALRLVPGVPALVDQHRETNGLVAKLLVVVVLFAAAAEAASHARSLSIWPAAWTLLLCAAAHGAGLLAAFGGGALAGLPSGRRVAVAFAGSQKTLPVGLYLFHAYYRDDYPLAVVPMLLYHAAQLLLDTWVADRLRAGTKTAHLPPPTP